MLIILFFKGFILLSFPFFKREKPCRKPDLFFLLQVIIGLMIRAARVRNDSFPALYHNMCLCGKKLGFQTFFLSLAPKFIHFLIVNRLS